MAGQLNPAFFNQYNVADSCSIWNILSSKTLYSAALTVTPKCYFSCTDFVYYECLIRPRKNESSPDKELRQLLVDEITKESQFQSYSLSIEDLQDVEVLENRKRVGKGELSSIIFAKKTRQAFITDDKKARNLAETYLDKRMVQTTPHLFGWLIYSGILVDSDKDKIIKEHSIFRTTKWGNLSNFFEVMYKKALAHRLMSITS